jgi:hypothetical protein
MAQETRNKKVTAPKKMENSPKKTVKQNMILFNTTTNFHRYQAPKGSAVENFYVRISEMPAEPPEKILVTIEY